MQDYSYKKKQDNYTFERIWQLKFGHTKPHHRCLTWSFRGLSIGCLIMLSMLLKTCNFRNVVVKSNEVKKVVLVTDYVVFSHIAKRPKHYLFMYKKWKKISLFCSILYFSTSSKNSYVRRLQAHDTHMLPSSILTENSIHLKPELERTSSPLNLRKK